MQNSSTGMLATRVPVGVVRSPAQIQQFEASLLEQRRLLKYYRDQISQLRRGVEAGKVQVGFGDQRFVEDAQVRA